MTMLIGLTADTKTLKINLIGSDIRSSYHKKNGQLYIDILGVPIYPHIIDIPEHNSAFVRQFVDNFHEH